MKDELIGFEVAKLARDKGFPQDETTTFDAYHKNGDLGSMLSSDKPHNINAPAQSLLRRWLREAHNIHIELIIDGWGKDNKVSDSICYRAFIWQVGEPKPGVADDLGCSDYEKILEVALYDALLLIKDK